eukprot:TRINITY_DN68805_c0_g1_i1.p1 TRINITY_DN68805_c0_g1~~TRINITY_DN68805_c0_g1_i1.p1  ORF type:complete len:295 (+),score=26.02 TRINITY_DN68805_c0_g1_i1:175-1059(+)
MATFLHVVTLDAITSQICEYLFMEDVFCLQASAVLMPDMKSSLEPIAKRQLRFIDLSNINFATIPKQVLGRIVSTLEGRCISWRAGSQQPMLLPPLPAGLRLVKAVSEAKKACRLHIEATGLAAAVGVGWFKLSRQMATSLCTLTDTGSIDEDTHVEAELPRIFAVLRGACGEKMIIVSVSLSVHAGQVCFSLRMRTDPNRPPAQERLPLPTFAIDIQAVCPGLVMNLKDVLLQPTPFSVSALSTIQVTDRNKLLQTATEEGILCALVVKEADDAACIRRPRQLRPLPPLFPPW